MSISLEKPSKVKLIAALMARSEELIEEVLSVLSRKYGAVDLTGPIFEFGHSDYYEDEMGKRLVKKFCSFHRLVDPDELVSLKLTAIECERRFLEKGTARRTVNIDPGYVDRMKLVLATTKNVYHRIYLGAGIYGDVELVYKSGQFTCLEWTFPDYREAPALQFFRQVRDRYLGQLRSGS